MSEVFDEIKALQGENASVGTTMNAWEGTWCLFMKKEEGKLCRRTRFFKSQPGMEEMITLTARIREKKLLPNGENRKKKRVKRKALD